MAPRKVDNGVDLFVTRRVNRRLMLLRPSRKTNRIVEYIVAVLSRKYGIGIHAICVLSNHWHLVIHDAFGNVVEFTRDCHHFIARAVNAAHGDEGSLWDSRATWRPRLVTPSDTLARIAYTMANPVKHGLVKNASSWPGLRRAWPAPAKTVKRPPHFFRAFGDDIEKGEWPETATLEMTRPRGFEHLDDNQLATLIGEHIAETEERFRTERAEAGGGWIGRRKVRRQSRHSRPKTRARDKKPRRNPAVICGDETLYKQAVAAERTFRAEHAESLAGWRAGDRDVVFPHGTYKMRVVHRANVAPAPP